MQLPVSEGQDNVRQDEKEVERAASNQKETETDPGKETRVMG